MRDHVTHHDDCGCQSAALTARIATLEQATELDAGAIREHLLRIATLEAELASSRLDADLAWKESGALGKERNEEAYQWMSHANALRDALENAAVTLRKNDLPHHSQVIVNILAQTPAASLAAHDAEVLERAAKFLDDRYPDSRFDGFNRQEAGLPPMTFGDAIRALAAQEVKP